MSIKSLTTLLDTQEEVLASTLVEALQCVPLGAKVVSAYKVGVGISNYLLFRRFAHFLEPLSGKEDKVNDFLDKMSPAEQEKLGEYLLSLLAKAESTEKARIMGFVFKSAVNKLIDQDLMLRLVSIIERSFVADLKHLPDYLIETDDFTIASNEFINLGLIDNEIGGSWKSQPAIQLNEIGRTLCMILETEGWFD
jgi:hypothetical protein